MQFRKCLQGNIDQVVWFVYNKIIDHLVNNFIVEEPGVKREEKNFQSKRKIIDSALLEFSEKNYGEASLNTICSLGGISKGIIYHYFKDKDELYLACIQECFDTLIDYLSTRIALDEQDIHKCLEKYFDSRLTFFNENPIYLKLFCSSVINPPIHLKEDILKIKSNFDNLNISVLKTLLKNVKLRKDITIDEVINTFRLYQDFLNARYQDEFSSEAGLHEHEKKCNLSLNILLYGVIQREDD